MMAGEQRAHGFGHRGHVDRAQRRAAFGHGAAHAHLASRPALPRRPRQRRRLQIFAAGVGDDRPTACVVHGGGGDVAACPQRVHVLAHGVAILERQRARHAGGQDLGLGDGFALHLLPMTHLVDGPEHDGGPDQQGGGQPGHPHHAPVGKVEGTKAHRFTVSASDNSLDEIDSPLRLASARST